MDIFKRKRYLWFTIIILIFMNLASITLLWVGKPEAGRFRDGPKNPSEEHKRIQHLLKKELEFDNKQVEQYLKIRKEHQDQMRLLSGEVKEIKRRMFDEVLEDNPQTELSDSLLALAQAKQAQLEQLTFQHFLDLKKLCRPEQQDKLKLLMHEVFRPSPPPGRDGDGPPPPPPPENE